MNVIQPLIKTKEELLFICPWWLLSYKSSDVDLTVNISLSCSLFQHLYLTMSEEAGDNEESAVNMQRNSQKIKHKAIPRFLDEILALPCLAMQSVFIDSSKTRPQLCEKAIRMVNSGGLYWKLRGWMRMREGQLNTCRRSEPAAVSFVKGYTIIGHLSIWLPYLWSHK